VEGIQGQEVDQEDLGTGQEDQEDLMMDQGEDLMMGQEDLRGTGEEGRRRGKRPQK
jgi:hypothetical protein